MQNEKSWGVSTKSSSNYINSPLKDASHIKAFMLEEAKERESTFLRQKNQELQDLVLRMGEEIMKINKDKKDLLGTNLSIFKRLTPNTSTRSTNSLSKITFSSTKSKSTKIYLKIAAHANAVRHPTCRDSSLILKRLPQSGEALHRPRAIDKVCLHSNSCKNADICELQQMKSELMRSNHTCIS